MLVSVLPLIFLLSSNVKASSAPLLLRDPGPTCTVPVSQKVDMDEYQKDLAQLLMPENVSEVVAFYVAVFGGESFQKVRQDASLLVELLLDSYLRISIGSLKTLRGLSTNTLIGSQYRQSYLSPRRYVLQHSKLDPLTKCPPQGLHELLGCLHQDPRPSVTYCPSSQ